MKIILLSGGSGKRLWPLSNDVRSKQFLKVVKNSDGEIESMVQRVYRQMVSAGIKADISIATSVTQVESIRNQLGDKVSIVVEPQRRNTFPAIALSAAHLFFEDNCSLDETVIVLPVDPYVDEEYFRTIAKLDEAVQNDVADIVLMGVQPTYPSEKYGYIIPAETDKVANKVAEFKEKPDAVTAQQFIDKGGLWNCGVFAFRLSYLMDIVNSTIKCCCYQDVAEQYTSFEKTSFDYAVVEKADSVAAVSYSGEWKDLGTWNTLTEVMDNAPIGNAIVSEDSVNTHVINEMDIPLIVMGADNMVIAASPDGILVADKNQSSYIKKYVEPLDLRPMFEERSWGDYTVLNVSMDSNGHKVVTKKKRIVEDGRIDMEIHDDHDEVWTVVSGKAVININGRNHEVLPGDTYTIPSGTPHSLTAIEQTEIIEIQINKNI